MWLEQRITALSAFIESVYAIVVTILKSWGLQRLVSKDILNGKGQSMMQNNLFHSPEYNDLLEAPFSTAT